MVQRTTFSLYLSLIIIRCESRNIGVNCKYPAACFVQSFRAERDRRDSTSVGVCLVFDCMLVLRGVAAGSRRVFLGGIRLCDSRLKSESLLIVCPVGEHRFESHSRLRILSWEVAIVFGSILTEDSGA